MKAIDLAKTIYPALSKQDIMQLTCPDILLIVDKVDCKKDKTIVDERCIECWDIEVSDKRAKRLKQAKEMCDLMCK